MSVPKNKNTLSKNEEDYLKAIFHLTFEIGEKTAGTNQLAQDLGISPASVTGMIKKLKTKKLVDSEKYGKLKLTKEGFAFATMLVRKHRLWETFLYQHLNFTWDEVHEVAEQLEHIKSPKLIEQLDIYLGKPKSDPHGDAIPDENGLFSLSTKISLDKVPLGKKCKVVSVKDSSVAFLQLVSKLGIGINSNIQIIDRQEFDGTLVIDIDGEKKHVSSKFAKNVFVRE
ncbi:MAG: metal-dependent transcriptional regulator [Salibacteraceae bacterium]